MASSVSDASPVKVLTVGPANGSIGELFSKIKAIDQKHGKFDLVLCLGDFFGPPGEEETNSDVAKLLNGEIEAPIECLIMQGEHPLPEAVIEKVAKTGSAVSKNVFLLHKHGLMSTAQGLRIACLGGVYDSSKYSADLPLDFTNSYFTKATVDKLLLNAQHVSSQSKDYTSLSAIQTSQLTDILLTNAWPSCITRHSSTPLPSPDLSSSGAPPVDEVVRTMKPRYVLSAGGGVPPKFWEREPFVWDQEQGRVSRFISLGAFGGEPVAGKKQRWFYAFSISPPTNPPAPTPRPSNATENPFVDSRAPKRSLEDAAAENFIWGSITHPGKRSRTDDGPGGSATGNRKPKPGYKCRKCDSTEHFIDDCPERAKPPEGYICKRCNNPGHFVRDCPTKHELGDTGGRKPRPGYVCRACASTEHYIDDCPVARSGPKEAAREGKGKGKKAARKEIGPDECWFCLSNPSIAKHLIVSIGSECYVTLPKGQLIPTHTADQHPKAPSVPGGGHVLIVPIAHYPTLASIAKELAAPVKAEMDRFKAALREAYAAHSASPVFFEVARHLSKGGHAHVQAIPVPSSLADKVEEAFLREGKSQSVDFVFDEEADEALQHSEKGYFRVDLPNGRKMVALMKDYVPFSVQFGRQVVANLLEMPERLDWKVCAQSEEEEKADVQAFKDIFASHDPTLQ